MQATSNSVEKFDWIQGDSTGLSIPAHAEALAAGGAKFLTEAFQSVGVLSADNSITGITECREIEGGSTGRKLLLGVEYRFPSPDLHEQLFVKFSRDFDNTMRDAARVQMEREVLFALLSSDPDFPIVVPRCYFADFNHATGTGILVTQRIEYGVNPVEPHYSKALDYRMPGQLEYYRTLIRSLARLAGTHKAGHLASTVEEHFPFELNKLVVSSREPYSPGQISERVAKYAEFAGACPQLLVENIRSAEFLSRLADEAPRFQALASKVTPVLGSNADMIALCHWNAHVDNAWFWRDDRGHLDCGLMDWGNVSQMNIAMAIWGCLSAAELDIWNNHLDELLDLFVLEYVRCGGVAIDVQQLTLHLLIYVGAMGMAWMLDTPGFMLRHEPRLFEALDRFDPLVEGNERVRSQLLILSVFMNLWEKSPMEEVLNYLQDFPVE